MSQRLSRFLVPTLVVTLLVWATPARANLITNPGFETGDFTGWTQSGNIGFTGVASGIFNGRLAAHNGIGFGAFAGPVGSLGSLSQILATTPGTTYDLSFFLQSDGRTPSRFQVSWNGTVISDLADLPLFTFQERNFSGLPATGAATELRLGFQNDPGFFNLDDVTVDPVASTPEPATLLLLGTTAAGLGLVRRWRGRAG